MDQHFKNNLLFVCVLRSNMWPDSSGYEWMQACVYGFGGVFKFEYDTIEVILSIGTRDGFG